LGSGTASNVAYRNLWQTAAASGIAVFVATGDSGSPACDQGGDAGGYPYEAQYGLSVNGIASTPFNTAVGGTDFNWCKPSYNSSGNFVGCASTDASTYWNTSNSSNQSTAKGYVPEAPWNDSCLNPVWANYLASIASLLKFTVPAIPEAACNFVYNNWKAINASQVQSTGQQFVLAWAIDTAGAGGGASNCVVNDGTNASSCAASTTSTGSSYGNLPLVNDGWPKPSWQTGIPGIPSDGVRDLPDVSFFSGDGSLNSATLVCLAAEGAACMSGSLSSTALEVGGTSVATPEMAGVMALINQNTGSPQGNPNVQLYQLASKQNYSTCSSENVSTSSSGCYFNDIDQGTITMPCATSTQTIEGGAIYNGNTGLWNTNSPTAQALASPNCTALNSGDLVGTLVSSGTTPGFNAAAGFDLATGLGSLNVANVVNASGIWIQTGSTTSTVTVTPASNSITPDVSLGVNIAVAGASGTPTGTVTVTSGLYTSSSASLSNGSASITIPANTLTGSGNSFTATINAHYSGDTTYAQAAGLANITVTKRMPTVTVTPSANSINSNVPLSVTVRIAGAGSTPTGTVTLAGGGYTSSATAISSGSATFTIPANTFTTGGSVTLAASYSGDATYATNTGSAGITVNLVQVLKPTVTVTPASSSSYTGQSLSVTVSVSGSGATPTGSVVLASGSYTSLSNALAGGSATIVILPNMLGAGSATLTATYSGDSNYSGSTGTATVQVTQSSFALAAGTPSPSSVSKGGSATVNITGSASSSSYSGTVSFSSGSCVLTSAPTGASSLPTCSATGTVSYIGGTPSGFATMTVATTASAQLVYPKLGNGQGWLDTGGGLLMAFLIFVGIPARRRNWRAMLGMATLLVVLGTLSACGGGSSGSSTSVSGTTSGGYIFTVTGTGSDSAATKASTTFTINVN
jgi:hypothetical protein